jgi:hypothetical protein
MSGAAERRVLDRDRLRVERIDLDDPAEPVGLVGFLVDIEAVVVLAPAVPVGGNPVAFVALLLVAAEASVEAPAVLRLAVGPEVAVKVFLGR